MISALRGARAGLADPNRPVGSFLFLGPTGVGKTELARSLAGALFDDERNMIRVDMSEYQERHSVARLIGAPPGYVGHDEGGQLTEAVRRKPYAVVLLDEIEKAHPEVFNTLLQVLDDGRLTDGRGRTVDFKNVLLIMTSNVGSETILERLSGEDEAYGEVGDAVLALVRRSFRPEFLNRIDEMIVFRPLSSSDLREIVGLQVAGLRARLAESGVVLELSEGALAHVAQVGHDPAWGARPLKRAIQTELETPLARMLLSGEAAAGSRVRVELGDDGLSFGVEERIARIAGLTYAMNATRVLSAAAVDADLAGACPLADRAEADLGQVALEPAIEPDSVVIGLDCEGANFVGGLHPAILITASPTIRPLIPIANDRIA